jgi:AraC-like DNA-binding protein
VSETYVEHLPWAALSGVVRTVWVQRTGSTAYVQRHLPTGGVELHVPIGGTPQLVGPLTGPRLEVIAAETTLVGARFHPGMAPLSATAVHDLIDEQVGLEEFWGARTHRLEDEVAAAASAGAALDVLQRQLLAAFRRAGGVDPLIREASRRLMPWSPFTIGAVAEHLALSESQLRRRCLHTVGLGPKTLQRTLRFQGFLALAQAGVVPRGTRGADGMAGLAVDVGYADQSHLSRECQRLTGLTPTALLGGGVDRCACGHDHSASYGPFLARRPRPPQPR